MVNQDRVILDLAVSKHAHVGTVSQGPYVVRNIGFKTDVKMSYRQQKP